MTLQFYCKMEFSEILGVRNRRIFKLFALALIFSCNPIQEYSVIIDNPRDQDIVVIIQEKEYEVPGFGSQTIILKDGKYNILASINDSCFFSDNIQINSDGILNTHQETYVLWTDLYVSKQKYYNKNELDIKNVEINGKKYNNVDFTIYKNKNFISKKWDFGWDEPWGNELKFYFFNSQKRSKIYRLTDLEEVFGYGETPDFIGYTIEDLRKKLDQLQLNN